MGSEVFCERMRHFVSVVKPMPQEKVLLMLDGHSSHIRSVTTIEVARKHGVIMLTLHFHSNAASRSRFIQAINDRIETERKPRAATVGRTYCISGSHGVPKGCNSGIGCESARQ
jgi:hypothetical protein